MFYLYPVINISNQQIIMNQSSADSLECSFKKITAINIYRLII